LRNSRYLLVIAWLSVLIGSGTSNSFEPVSASEDACVAELTQVQGNPALIGTRYFDIQSNAVVCLAQSESATTEGEGCVAELVRIRVNPYATIGELGDAISNATICLAST
jgi:hypothetical protein